jgi:hypothetical protein
MIIVRILAIWALINSGLAVGRACVAEAGCHPTGQRVSDRAIRFMIGRLAHYFPATSCRSRAALGSARPIARSAR